MSEEIPPSDLCKKRLIIWLSIPNETWTDVFLVLSRRILLQTVQPSCHRFNAIGNKNVKNVHIVETPKEFVEKLAENDPVAKEQLKHLASSNRPFCGQIRMNRFPVAIPFGDEMFFNPRRPIFNANQLQLPPNLIPGLRRFHQYQKAVMRHSMELFRGCDLRLFLVRRSYELFAYLTLFETAACKPVHVFLTTMLLYNCDMKPRPNVSYFLRHPIVMKCNKLTLNGPTHARANCNAILDWLHYRAIDENCSIVEEAEQRCLILIRSPFDNVHQIVQLLEQSLQYFQQSHSPLDRRQFMLVFSYNGEKNLMEKYGRKVNPTTGEVFKLERVAYGDRMADGTPLEGYRLRRCLLEDETGTEEFYRRTFKSTRHFKLADEETGNEPVFMEIR